MTESTVGARRSPLGQLARRVQRERALIALLERGLQRTFLLRAARLYAIGVFIGYAIAISLAHASDRAAVVQGFVRAALITLSWVVGALATLGTAQALAQQSERDGLAALAQQRGFPEHALTRARVWAGAQRVARLVGIPALLLVGVGLARGQALPWALVTVPAVLVYAGALGLSLAVLAQFSAQLAPRHARALVAALVLGPWLFSQVFPGFLSLPELLSALLDRLMNAGARLT